MKLAFVSAHPAPYRDPFLRRLSACDELETKIFTLYADDNGHAYWNLAHQGYPSEIVGVRGTHWLRMFARLFWRVICGGYDVICWPGFHRPCTKLAMIVCALLGKRYGFCADSISQPQRNGLTLAIKRYLVRHADFIFVPGQASRDFYAREFGYPAERICLGQYALEGEAIEENILKLRRGSKDALRAKFGLRPDEVVFLMVANMLPTRHYPVTASAFVRFAKDCPKARFVMVGKGADLETMQRMAKEHSELVVVPGVSFADMQELYAVADVYVHGGTEPASTALVIGAIANLPVVSSPSVGCTADVVRDGESGVLVQDYLSEDEWCSAFSRLWKDREKWYNFGVRARALSRNLDCARTIERFVGMLARKG